MRRALNQAPQAAPKRLLARMELKFRRILVPMDFSGQSRQALTCAVPLARKHGAKISLVHVIMQPPVVMGGLPESGIQMPLSINDLAESARAHLDDLATELLPPDLRAQTLVTTGNPAHEINAAAMELKADLIVLSTHGFTGLTRVLLGSTAERIVRHAQCPVLTVRRKPGAPAMRMLSQQNPVCPERLPWRRMLVPLDFSLTSLRALQMAVLLAKQNDARLFLLNVVEPNPYPTGMEGAVLVVPDSAVARNASEQLPRVAKQFVPKSVRVTSLVGRGRAANVIVETAEAKDVDLIVLSTHGYTGLDRLLMGSTGEQVVRHAKCPVFVVRKSRARSTVRVCLTH